MYKLDKSPAEKGARKKNKGRNETEQQKETEGEVEGVGLEKRVKDETIVTNRQRKHLEKVVLGMMALRGNS